MRLDVNTIEENSTTILTSFNIWMWKYDESWGTLDNITEASYLKNPNLYPPNFNFSTYLPFVPFWLPVPIGDYLGEMKLGNLYDVDNRVLPTLNVQVEKDYIQPNIPTENVYIIAVYNLKGILSSFKLYKTGNVVVIDISLDEIPLCITCHNKFNKCIFDCYIFICKEKTKYITFYNYLLRLTWILKHDLLKLRISL